MTVSDAFVAYAFVDFFVTAFRFTLRRIRALRQSQGN